MTAKFTDGHPLTHWPRPHARKTRGGSPQHQSRLLRTRRAHLLASWITLSLSNKQAARTQRVSHVCMYARRSFASTAEQRRHFHPTTNQDACHVNHSTESNTPLIFTACMNEDPQPQPVAVPTTLSLCDVLMRLTVTNGPTQQRRRQTRRRGGLTTVGQPPRRRLPPGTLPEASTTLFAKSE